MSAPTPTLINGTSGVASVSINALLYDCVMGRWRGSGTKAYYNQITFCSGGWRDEVAGLKAVDIISEGFLSHGNAISDPFLDFGTVTGVPCIFQADTTCTISGTFHIEPAFGVTAFGPSEMAKSCRSKGIIASSWNITT